MQLSTAGAAKAAKNLLYLMNEASGDNNLTGSEQPSSSCFTRATFTKAERLCSKKLISKVFEEGKQFFERPLKVIYFEDKIISTFPVQILFTVPKKSFAKAHDRNRVKRLLREAYRCNKNSLYNTLAQRNKTMAIIIIYTSKTIANFNEVENLMKVTLKRLSEIYIK